MIAGLPPLDKRIPVWNEAALTARDCPICEAAAGVADCVRPDGLSVVKCPACESYFVSPAPSAADLDRFYATYTDTHFTSVFTGPAQLRAFLDGSDPRNDPRVLALQSKMRVEGAAILDVGCGRGEFLFQLQKLRAEAVGVELDPRAAEIARLIGVRQIYNDYLDRIDFGRQFDAVTLNDVIEHPLQPRTLLTEAKSVLRDGGLLLIWTPSGNAPDSDPEKITFRVDLEHMQYLSTRGIQVLAADGWDIIHLETLGFPKLDGISAPGATGRGLPARLRSMLRTLPGASRMRNMRAALAMTRGGRAGNYHLLAILRKRS